MTSFMDFMKGGQLKSLQPGSVGPKLLVLCKNSFFKIEALQLQVASLWLNLLLKFYKRD